MRALLTAIIAALAGVPLAGYVGHALGYRDAPLVAAIGAIVLGIPVMLISGVALVVLGGDDGADGTSRGCCGATPRCS